MRALGQSRVRPWGPDVGPEIDVLTLIPAMVGAPLSESIPARIQESGIATIRIHDLRGQLVRTLRGGRATDNRVAIQWRGDDESGGAAASGRYLYVMTAAGCTARGSVTLVR